MSDHKPSGRLLTILHDSGVGECIRFMQEWQNSKQVLLFHFLHTPHHSTFSFHFTTAPNDTRKSDSFTTFKTYSGMSLAQMMPFDEDGTVHNRMGGNSSASLSSSFILCAQGLQQLLAMQVPDCGVAHNAYSMFNYLL